MNGFRSWPVLHLPVTSPDNPSRRVVSKLIIDFKDDSHLLTNPRWLQYLRWLRQDQYLSMRERLKMRHSGV